MNIRKESEADLKQIYEVNYEAFGGRDDEAKLVERIRASACFIPELSLVAELDGSIVGHLLLSKATATGPNGSQTVIALAPIAVKPSYQKQGIGGKLIEEGKRVCRELGYGVILLIGHPSYYPRFGFVPARAHGYELTQYKVPDHVFMACELIPGKLDQLKGELTYPPAFFE